MFSSDLQVSFLERVSEAFVEVLDTDEAQREASLKRICGGSPDLEREVRKLLQCSEAAPDFLENSLVESVEPPASGPAFSDGDILCGRFRLVRLLGSGGMGEVYEAFDERLGAPVAVKTIRAAVASDPAMSACFRREVLRARQIAHPNVCRVYDLFVHLERETKAEVPFFTMELLSGETLAQLLARRGKLPPCEALIIIRQIAAALDEAHSRGVVHRDLKPANVFLSGSAAGDMKAVVTDFGIAAETGSAASPPDSDGPPAGSIELTGLAGAPAYMAPEQFAGEAAAVASDIYALGLVAFEMVAGRRAYELHSPLAIALRKTGPGTDVTWLKDIPRKWRRAIARCTQKEPSRRFASAREFMEAIAGPGTQYLRWVAGLIVVLALATGATVFASKAGLFSATESAPIGADQRIAVLPFENLSGEPRLRYFSDGLAREIASQLTAFPKLHVAAWASALQFRNSKEPLPQIASKLGVRLMIMGSVQRTPERVKISVELLDATSGRQLWSQIYDRDIGQLALVVNEIRADAARRMNLGPRPESAGRELRVSSKAFELYLKGRYTQENRTREAMLEGLRYLEQAVEADPNFAPAHTAIAATYVLMADYGWVAAGEVESKVSDALDRSLRLDERSPETQAVLGLFRHVIQWDQAGAETAFGQAISSQPSLLDAHHWYGSALMRARRYKEAVAEAQTARNLDPLSIRAIVFEGWVHYYQRDYQKAVTLAKEAITISPGAPHAHHLLAMSYAGLQRPAEALNSMQTAISLIKDQAVSLRYQALVLSLLPGQEGAARERAHELERVSTGRQAGYLAIIYGGIGDQERMFSWVDQALEIRDSSITMANIAPGLDRFRHQPRFEQAMRRVGYNN